MMNFYYLISGMAYFQLPDIFENIYFSSQILNHLKFPIWLESKFNLKMNGWLLMSLHVKLAQP